MAHASLGPAAYVVLGLLATYGPATPYDLKRWVDGSIGYFWSFPRAQLYVEPARLERLGLVHEEREAGGRRRRVYSVTDAGRAALLDWLRTEQDAPVELRDPGLLKLFFAAAATREDVVALAHAQAETHAQRLREFERIQQMIADDPRQVFARATLRLGLLHEQAAVAFWHEIAEHPP